MDGNFESGAGWGVNAPADAKLVQGWGEVQSESSTFSIRHFIALQGGCLLATGPSTSMSSQWVLAPKGEVSEEWVTRKFNVQAPVFFVQKKFVSSQHAPLFKQCSIVLEDLVGCRSMMKSPGQCCWPPAWPTENGPTNGRRECTSSDWGNHFHAKGATRP